MQAQLPIWGLENRAAPEQLVSVFNAIQLLSARIFQGHQDDVVLQCIRAASMLALRQKLKQSANIRYAALTGPIVLIQRLF